jgi:hypothetical protein
MHCEKNFYENMLKTTLSAKDNYGNRQDMEQRRTREELWLRPSQNQWDIFHMPLAPYVLKPNEKVIVMDIVKKLKTPSNYVGAIHKCLANGKLRYMKSHDFHVLMHQVGIYSACSCYALSWLNFKVHIKFVLEAFVNDVLLCSDCVTSS